MAAAPAVTVWRPNIIRRATPNTSGPMGRVRGIKVHASRSGKAGNPTEGAGTQNYVLTPGTTSYNDLILEDGTLVELSEEATWHAEEYNRNWWAICVPQGTLDDPLYEKVMRTLKWRLHERSQYFELPYRRVYPTSPTSVEGITQHMDSNQGKRWGKSDVGYQLDWAYLGL